MNTEEMYQLRALADAAIERVVKQHQLAADSLTEKQLVELLKQVLASGDIIKHTVVYSDAQSVVYIPFAQTDRLRDQLYRVRQLCKEQHDMQIREGGVPKQVPCECFECLFKRRILEELL